MALLFVIVIFIRQLKMGLPCDMKLLYTKFIHKFDVNFYKNMLSDDSILAQLDEILLDNDSDDNFIFEIEEFDEENYEELIGTFV